MLRIPSPNSSSGAGQKEAIQNIREHRGKAKQFTTINGKTVIIKDSFVYANKGTQDRKVLCKVCTLLMGFRV